MTKLTLYIATSLDGYIASTNDGLDWLSSVEVDGEDYGYDAFYASTDALIMGSHTYQKILEFGEWPYPGKPCWVCTQQTLKPITSDVIISHSTPCEIMTELKQRGLQHAWLVGGGRLAVSFANDKLISEYIVSIIPILLGEGIPLFPSPGQQASLKLMDSTKFSSGLVQLRYSVPQ